MEKLYEILNDIRPDVDFQTEDKLIDSSILDSFDIITIVSEINDAFDIEINFTDLIPKNMNNAKAMWELINRLKK